MVSPSKLAFYECVRRNDIRLNAIRDLMAFHIDHVLGLYQYPDQCHSSALTQAIYHEHPDFWYYAVGYNWHKEFIDSWAMTGNQLRRHGVVFEAKHTWRFGVSHTRFGPFSNFYGVRRDATQAIWRNDR